MALTTPPTASARPSAPGCSFSRAALIAALFAVLGALLQGEQVMKTIGMGIVHRKLDMIACCVALLSGGLFVTLATFKRIPTPASPAVVGGAVGTGLAMEASINTGKLWTIAGSEKFRCYWEVDHCRNRAVSRVRLKGIAIPKSGNDPSASSQAVRRGPVNRIDRDLFMALEFGKYCAVCGRRMVLRRKWRRSWENVRYCSRICRESSLNIEDLRLEAVILELLYAHGASDTICPSEAARIVSGRRTGDRWRALMPAARRAARRLAAKGRVEFLQKGRPVDASTARGPIRIRLRT